MIRKRGENGQKKRCFIPVCGSSKSIIDDEVALQKQNPPAPKNAVFKNCLLSISLVFCNLSIIKPYEIQTEKILLFPAE